MEQHPVDASPLTSAELKSLESGLKGLWERVRQVGETIAQLRQEKSSLQARVNELEAQLQTVDRELLKRDHQLKEMAAQQAVAVPRDGLMVANGEREVLTTRLKDLLARIDAYL